MKGLRQGNPTAADLTLPPDLVLCQACPRGDDNDGRALDTTLTTLCAEGAESARGATSSEGAV